MQPNLDKIDFKLTRVYYLKMEHRPAAGLPDSDQNIKFELLQKPVDPDSYLKYYEGVGFNYNWLDRLVMPKEELRTKINAPNVHIHLMRVNGEDAGFLELVQEDDYVELLYFGLLPGFIGKGLGKCFLNWSIHKAWSYNPKWIQLNTCELDHDNALSNYMKLGFIDYKMTLESRRVLNTVS